MSTIAAAPLLGRVPRRSPALPDSVRDAEAGALVVRELRPDEPAVVQRVFEGLSNRSRRLRFLTGVPRLTGSMLRVLSGVEAGRHHAWVAELHAEPVGISRVILPFRGALEGEVAIEVVDAHQRRGVGRALLDAAMDGAARLGVQDLVWTADPDNAGVRRLLGGRGTSVSWVDGLVEGRTPVRAPIG